MDVKRTAEQLADTLWDLLTDDRMGGHTVQHLSQDRTASSPPTGTRASAPTTSRTQSTGLCDRLGPDQPTQVARDPQRGASLPVAPRPPAPAPTPAHRRPPSTRWPRSRRCRAPGDSPCERAAGHPRARERRAPRVRDENATTNHYVREGDLVDEQPVITQSGGGDVDFDQKVENKTTTALKGGVAVDGDVEDSVINTGVNRGVIAGDDVDLEDRSSATTTCR